ncbi:LPS export ABC transporter periplasmic protein LptC [Geothermobacter hydrogeniphilus]|uniref:LPS export ABC transporter periplasmic protein LptC n=1 Tax=Geothermobacter hydrogeniphilus TaxID=1969733 RepID=A0A1X0Y346_9BACT|nr:LPS export ABC transporter periplasmic protein LptC [Geothermobacter hydrogeniphilus]ORJ59549.1 LPS export ABC transporter periplasmic protein LptC [Geothermobacter hydrogeniphilus]
MKQFFSARHLLVVAILVLSGMLVLVISRRYTRIEPVAVDVPAAGADLSLAKIDYTETRGGKAFWRLRADRASYDLETGRSRLHNVHLRFFGAGESGVLTLDARRGVWDEKAGELVVSGNVVARSERGYEFSTDRLHYRQAERLLWTDQPVRLSSGQFEVEATGMRLLVDQRRLKLLANVRSKWLIRPDDEEKG